MHKKEKRADVKYESKSDKFALKSLVYSKQYAHVYAHRLKEASKLLLALIAEKWDGKYPVRKLFELREENTEKCVIVGTLFKHQQHKPSILRDICEENQLVPQPTRSHYASEDDKLILEDELQRVKLAGNVDVAGSTTGVVCAVLGTIEAGGTFVVDEVLFYESGPQRSLSKRKADGAPLLVLVSGLDQLSSLRYASSLDLFQQWLSGNFGTSEAVNVVRVIVAGNSVRSMPEFKQSALQYRKQESSTTFGAIKELDRWFEAWSQSVHVDLMPGEFDPSNYMLPQQPFHPCMFPGANRNTSFRSVTNPYALELDDVHVIGTSGQNVDNIIKTTTIQNPLEALKSTLVWSHVAPTCPDTLPCYPYVDEDPFIIYECPHIYFAGNTDEFQTELHTSADGQKKTRLICVPSFSKTQTIAVVNLHTLDCKSVSFQVAL